MTRAPKNIGLSVQDRLLRLSRERGEDLQLLLLRFVNERVLYRLSISNYRTAFVLKGAALFVAWVDAAHRATRDLDLLGYGDPSAARLREVLVEILGVETVDDGVRFDLAGLTVGEIREGQVYGGQRARLEAHVGKARLQLQIDVGFGDPIVPAATDLEYPVLLDFPAPNVRAYPPETVVAEKLEALVQLGLANSRMKDFFDLLTLSGVMEFDGAVLAAAVRATFANRCTAIPTGIPIGLSDVFAADASKRAQWSGFVRKTGIPSPPTLTVVVTSVRPFALPLLAAAAGQEPFAVRWTPGVGWA